MRRVEIPEPVLRDLVTRHPFQTIAKIYQCDTRVVGALAARYGLVSAFKAKAGTAEERARIRALAEDGLSIKRIATEIGRSQEFVARRLRDDPTEIRAPMGRRPKSGWPAPDTHAAAALGARRYDDMDEAVLCRECPPHRPVLNGAALAAAARAREMSFSRSSAALCADEGAGEPHPELTQGTEHDQTHAANSQGRPAPQQPPGDRSGHP